MLKRLLEHPLTRGLDIDDPATTVFRRTILQNKPFLRKIYEEWYERIASSLPGPPGAVLEIGSGAGFLADRIADLITSEVFLCPHARVVLDAQALPFTGNSLRAVVMTNVLHHIPDVRSFLREATRCLRPGGVIAMVEPWVSAWSHLIYTRFHHEPFDPQARTWAFSGSGPLSDANGALPYIVFQRDRTLFESEFPDLKIVRIEPFMPFRYLLSGGVSLRPLMPGFTYPLWKRLELSMQPWIERWAMFAQVVIAKRSGGPVPAIRI